MMKRVAPSKSGREKDNGFLTNDHAKPFFLVNALLNTIATNINTTHGYNSETECEFASFSHVFSVVLPPFLFIKRERGRGQKEKEKGGILCDFYYLLLHVYSKSS